MITVITEQPLNYIHVLTLSGIFPRLFFVCFFCFPGKTLGSSDCCYKDCLLTCFVDSACQRRCLSRAERPPSATVQTEVIYQAVSHLRPGGLYDRRHENWKCSSLDRHLPVGCEGGAALWGLFPPPHLSLLILTTFNRWDSMATSHCCNIHDSKTLCLIYAFWSCRQEKLHRSFHGKGIINAWIRLTNYTVDHLLKEIFKVASRAGSAGTNGAKKSVRCLTIVLIHSGCHYLLHSYDEIIWCNKLRVHDAINNNIYISHNSSSLVLIKPLLID